MNEILTTEQFLEMFKQIQNNSFKLVESKNSDYGFSFVTDGFEGIIVRLTDKLNRLRTLSSGVEQKIKDELITDILMDMQNYSIIGMICLIKNLHSPLFKRKEVEGTEK